MAPPAKKGAAFFDELLKNSDPEIVKRIKAGVGDDPTTSGKLVAHILHGKLTLSVDNVNGWGEYSVTAGGGFQGNTLSPTVTGGKFKLWVKSENATLQLYDTAGNPLKPIYEGTGEQAGLDTPDDKPWEGDWD